MHTYICIYIHTYTHVYFKMNRSANDFKVCI